jgi:hypothetical protein
MAKHTVRRLRRRLSAWVWSRRQLERIVRRQYDYIVDLEERLRR